MMQNGKGDSLSDSCFIFGTPENSQSLYHSSWLIGFDWVQAAGLCPSLKVRTNRWTGYESMYPARNRPLFNGYNIKPIK
jgi:hypothetical protein